MSPRRSKYLNYQGSGAPIVRKPFNRRMMTLLDDSTGNVEKTRTAPREALRRLSPLSVPNEADGLASAARPGFHRAGGKLQPLRTGA